MKRIIAPIACGFAFVFFACAGPNPAGPPAPPAELPSALRFPASIEISSAKITPAGDLGSGDLADEIGQSAFYASTTAAFIDAVLTRLSTFDIPVSLSTAHFQTSLDVDGDGVNEDVKIDFAPYAFDALGRGTDCKGNTAELPICYRIWADGTRLLAGIFESEFPTAAVVGAGRFKFGDRPTEFLGVGVVYDHTAAPTRSDEYFLLNDSSQPSAPPSFFDNLHVLLEQVGPDATALKTLRLNSLANPGNTEPAGSFAYIGRWVEDNFFWSGSIRDDRGVFSEFTDLCARITTASASDLLNCDDLGIRVNNVEFIDLAPDDSAGFPAGFPPSPTF